MRKLISKFLAAVMVLSVLAGIAPATEAQAAEATTKIPLTVVKDINYEAVDAQVVGDSVTDISGAEASAYKKVYTFTLTKPAYVKTSIYSTISHGNWGNLGTLVQYKMSYNSAGTNLIKGTSLKTVEKNQEGINYLVLDAGTYYVTVTLKNSSDISSGDYSLSVLAQYRDVITRNATKASAKLVSTDKQNTGIITATTRNSWYKFKVSGKTNVSITTWLDSVWSTDRGNVKYGATAVMLWDSKNKVVAFWNTPEICGASSTMQDITLDSGTYYLSFYGGQYYDTWKNLETASAESNSLRNGGEVKFKITTIKAPTSPKVVNQAGKKAKVTFKKSASAKGYEIQCSTDKNFKSGVKTTATSKTSATIKSLKKNKTYYVRIRAWRYDADSNKLYSAWTTAKSVKIKK